MNCPRCKQAQTPERNFCGACGNALAQFCRCCGFRNPAADRFCGGCGAPLGQAAAAGARVSSTEAVGGASAPDPAREPGADDGLAELIEAAREEPPAPDDAAVRVSQDDIDSLFGD